MHLTCVCSLEEMSCPGLSAGTEVQGQAWVMFFEAGILCSDDGGPDCALTKTIMSSLK